MAWEGRPIPQRLRASRDRKARLAWIMELPGMPACLTMPSGSHRARSGANRNRSPGAGAEALRGEVEGASVGNRCPLGPGLLALLRGAAPQLGKARLPEHSVHGGGAGGQPFPRQGRTDVLHGDVALLAQRNHALAAPDPAGHCGLRLGARLTGHEEGAAGFLRNSVHGLRKAPSL